MLHMELVVRPPTVEDAPALHEAVMASLEHLRPWMPWIAFEPQTVEQRRERIATWTESYAMLLDDVLVGMSGIHDRIGGGGLEIGYWVRVDQIGRGYATEAARQLSEIALARPGIDHVEIHHDKANVASGRVPAKLGFTLVREVPDEITSPGECGISCEWSLTRG